MNIAQYQIDLEEVCLMDIVLCERTQMLYQYRFVMLAFMIILMLVLQAIWIILKC